MKAFISIDMEGICGVVREIETDPIKGGEAYQQSRHLMTQEANAAIEGCVKAGATDILIADSHWNFDNLIPEELHEAATLLRGTPRGFSMVEALDASADAALFIGYHARAGTPRAILDHTYSGTVAAVRVNGTEVGETGINAFLAGHHGVPVVLVTGDRALTAEAKALLPNVHTVAVKDATGGNVGEESASEEGARTDPERSHKGGARREDDRTSASEDPNPDGRRVPWHVCSRPCRDDPDRPTCRRIAG